MSASIVRRGKKKQNAPFGFITLVDEERKAAAIQGMDGKVVDDGNVIEVKASFGKRT